jgi:hypothetical protein
MKSRPVEKSVRRKRQRSSFSLDFISFRLLFPARAECCYSVHQTSARPAAAEHRAAGAAKEPNWYKYKGRMDGWMDGWIYVTAHT